MNKKIILIVDAGINYMLGIFLMCYPFNISALLGLPVTNQYFYPVIFGAVLFGIGIALTIECIKGDKQITGLGLAGAIAINLCGGFALALWLMFANPDIPLRGSILLTIVAILVISISLIEIYINLKSKEI
jgi:hypothetical protein